MDGAGGERRAKVYGANARFRKRKKSKIENEKFKKSEKSGCCSLVVASRIVDNAVFKLSGGENCLLWSIIPPSINSSILSDFCVFLSSEMSGTVIFTLYARICVCAYMYIHYYSIIM